MSSLDDSLPQISSTYRRLGAATMALLSCAMLCAQAQMPMPAKAPAKQSISLTLTLGGKTTTLKAADLQAMPQHTVTVHNEHTKGDESYTGVLLGDLLEKNGFPIDKSTHQQMLRSYVRAEGTDEYWVLYSMTEI